MRRIAGSLAVSLIAGSALAADLDCTQIKLVVPYPAGGATDVGARLVGERLEASLKRNVIIETRSGRDRQHRHRRGDQFQAGRLHAPGERRRHRDVPGELRPAQLRSDPGPHPGRRHRHHADPAGYGAVGRRQRHQVAGPAEQGQARRPELQHRWLRPAAAPRGRGDRAAHGREGHPYHLQGRRPGGDRPRHRASRFRQLRCRNGQSVPAGRQAQGAGGGAGSEVAARCPTWHHRRAGLARPQCGRAFHGVRARRHAQGCRRPSQWRDAQGGG